MKIVKGQKYLCTADYYLLNNCMWHKGKIYEAVADDLLRGEISTYCSTKDLTIFEPLSSAKWAVKRTPENADVVNRWAASQFVVTPNVFVYHDKLVSYELLDGYTEIDFETFKEITGMGEEKPKQLLGEKEAVHCPTLELAEKVIEILKRNGKNPSFNASVYFNEKGIGLCFRTFGYFGYAHREFYETEGYTIIPAEQFIERYEPKIFTIEDARNGKCAIENDGTVEELNKVLKLCFPKDRVTSNGLHKYYMRSSNEEWDRDNKTDLPTQSVKLFLSQIERGKDQPTEEWQPKAENGFSPKWGEPVEVRDYDEQKWQKALFVGLNPNENQAKYITVRKDKSGVGIWSQIRQPIHTFTTEQAKKDLAKLHSLNVNQIKIVE